MVDPMHFETRAEIYERARPPYPKVLWDRLRELGVLRAGVCVVELGAGTGQATEHLLDAEAVVTAVEPGRSLAERLRRRCPSARVVVARAEDAEMGRPSMRSPLLRRPCTGSIWTSCFPSFIARSCVAVTSRYGARLSVIPIRAPDFGTVWTRSSLCVAAKLTGARPANSTLRSGLSDWLRAASSRSSTLTTSGGALTSTPTRSTTCSALSATGLRKRSTPQQRPLVSWVGL
jgi:SAM-dependent methyltransferase